MRLFLVFSLLATILFATNLKLTKTQANYIAKKVWQNEGAGKEKYLIWWNKGEDFASLGIGHFIWFPKNHTERFREVFPMVVDFISKKNVPIPSWLNSNSDFPWQTKEEFLKAKKLKNKRYIELFNFLKKTMPYQAEFMANRLSQALPSMIKSIRNSEQRRIVKKRFNDILYHSNGKINERGLYVLLDYTNFKGEGTLKSERYKGQGWGLLQVLLNINDKELNKEKAFAKSAINMLSRRIKNSPPQRGEERWRKGWNIRLNTYWQ